MTTTRDVRGPRGKVAKNAVPKRVARKADGIGAANRNREQSILSRGHLVRIQRIAEVAYFIAQKRGFTEGAPLEDWLTAEAQVDRLLSVRGH